MWRWIVNFLFNSRGQHIANERNGQLHSKNGSNIGHYRENEQIFIDMNGHYLGEIIHDDRLVYNRTSPYQNVNFGIYGNYGNIGNYGNPGNRGSVSLPAGFDDIPIEKLG
jgi:hypothetical protein